VLHNWELRDFGPVTAAGNLVNFGKNGQLHIQDAFHAKTALTWAEQIVEILLAATAITVDESLHHCTGRCEPCAMSTVQAQAGQGCLSELRFGGTHRMISVCGGASGRG
jgi:hypothetical protein